MPIGEHRRRNFPGLIPIEAELWRSWLLTHEQDFDEFEYNVLVGEGIGATIKDPTFPEDLRKALEAAWKAWTKKKIDVVGRRGSEWWIFEVEDRPGARALGQLMNYRSLLPRSRPEVIQIQLAVVARFVGNDQLQVMEDNDIIVWRVEKADEP